MSKLARTYLRASAHHSSQHERARKDFKAVDRSESMPGKCSSREQIMKLRRPPATSHDSASSTGATPTKDKENSTPNDAATTDDPVQKIDRPGFDLGGSSGKNQAGTGLGLGDDAFDTPGDRRLPGRRFGKKLTLPRWGGQDPHGAPLPGGKPEGLEPPTAPATRRRGVD